MQCFRTICFEVGAVEVYTIQDEQKLLDIWLLLKNHSTSGDKYKLKCVSKHATLVFVSMCDSAAAVRRLQDLTLRNRTYKYAAACK